MVWEKIKSRIPKQFFGSQVQESSQVTRAFILPSSQIDASDQAIKQKKSVYRSTASRWQLACADYQEHLKFNALPAQSDSFARFSTTHAALADLLLDRHAEIVSHGKQRVVHISSTAGLLAVYSPAQRTVQLRSQPTAFGRGLQEHELVLRVMPQSACLLEGDAARGFYVHSVASLMWYFGQTDVRALACVPNIQRQILRIQSFPLLDPASLLLRHLRLLHVLSHRDHSFESLQPELTEEQQRSICPDIAALYLTGALSFQAA